MIVTMTFDTNTTVMVPVPVIVRCKVQLEEGFKSSNPALGPWL